MKMFKKEAQIHSNGTNEPVSTKNYRESVRLWKKIQINEWTFSFTLFVISLSIVLGKLCINYGGILQRENNNKYTVPTRSSVLSISDVIIPKLPNFTEFNVKKLADASESFINVSSYYEHVVVSAATSFLEMYGWLIRATICGLIMMGFTWFIVYKDSSIPGIRPPSPFSPNKKRQPMVSRVQMNYSIGIVNGILIFVYMCL